MLKFSVDRGKCIGCGMCSTLCPGIFEMGPTGEAHVKEEYRDEDISQGRGFQKRKFASPMPRRAAP
ncbi:MAG: ferredoxin [Candidatus Thermoplasmatota archaeon]